MEQEQHKLTRRQPSRYDRHMSEAAVLEQHPTYNQAIYDSWANDFANAQSSSEREGIWAAIKAGVPKDQRIGKGLSEEEVKRIKDDMSSEKVKELTDEMDTKESKERKRTAMEKDIDRFMEANAKVSDYTKEGASHPKYDLPGKKGIEKENLNEKKDWSDIGWGETERHDVEQRLTRKLGWSPDDARVKNAVDLFVKTGQTATEIASKIDPSQEEFSLDESDYEQLAKNSRLTAEDIISSKKLNWFAKLGIKETYIKRFVLLEEFHEEIEDNYQRTDPPNIEEVAWQIMHHYKHTNWGPHGNFPLLEMRIAKDKNGRVDPEKSKYYLNQSNFAVWARERMWSQYDQNNDIGDFMATIDIPKTLGALNFSKMFPEFQKYFGSEDGETNYNYLAQELIVEAHGQGTLNQMAVLYKQEMQGGPKKLVEAMGKLLSNNIFTKETFRKNLIELMMIMPLRYEGNKTGELLESDGIFGSTINEMFLAYYNLSDFDALQKLLGKGSSFFTRDGFLQAFQTVAEDKSGESSGETRPTVMNAEMQDLVEEAYDESGQVTEKTKDSFIKLINFFGSKLNNTDTEYTVRRMLYQQVAEKYGRVMKDKDGKDKKVTIYYHDKEGNELTKDVKRYGFSADAEGKKEDTWTLRMGWVAARAMAVVFGAQARNDTTAQGYDPMTKMHYAELYRDKMLNKNGDESGNPYTIHQFKTFSMDFFNATVTESFEYVRDEDGYIKTDKHGKPMTRKKTAMEVLLEMNETSTAYAAQLKQLEEKYMETPDGSGKEKALEELNKFKEKKSKQFLNKAGELTFQNRAMSNYYDDHLMRAHEIWETIMAAGELSMDKYVRYDAVGGVHFNRAEFQKDVQHNLMHPIRYFISTFPDVKYNQKRRMLDQAETIRQHKPVYKEMYLGEAMFGHELLNREAFWKKDDRGKAINIRDNKGRKMKGIYEIDYDKVEDNKMLVWKQWFATKIAADLWSHRDFHSTDTRFDLNYYQNVINAIESIPGGFSDDDQQHGKPGLIGDEFSIRDQHISRRFFDKKDIAWLRKTAKSENFDLYFRAVFKDILLDDDKDEGIGLLSALSVFTRQIIKQGG